MGSFISISRERILGFCPFESKVIRQRLWFYSTYIHFFNRLNLKQTKIQMQMYGKLLGVHIKNTMKNRRKRNRLVKRKKLKCASGKVRIS